MTLLPQGVVSEDSDDDPYLVEKIVSETINMNILSNGLAMVRKRTHGSVQVTFPPCILSAFERA